MKINPALSLRTIAGEKIVVIPPKSSGQNSLIMSMNSVSAFIWENFQGKEFEVEDVVRLLLDEYDVSEEKAREDVIAWLKKMDDAGVML